jgi:hypothetical protein
VVIEPDELPEHAGKQKVLIPQAWLTQTLGRIAKGWPSSDLDALMPWNYAG